MRTGSKHFQNRQKNDEAKNHKDLDIDILLFPETADAILLVELAQQMVLTRDECSYHSSTHNDMSCYASRECY